MRTGNGVFQIKEGSGWSRGLETLLAVEFGRWFRTRRWWIQILVWAAIINLVLLATVLDPESGGSAASAVLFCVFVGIFAPIGVCVLTQGSIVGERVSGTAAWVLSKPLSRPAFIIAKVIANAAGVAVTIVLVQGLIAYGIVYFGGGTALPPLGYLAGLGALLIYLLFTLTLTFTLGTIFNRRGPVIAIPMVLLLAQEALLGLFPVLNSILPYGLALPLDNTPYPAVAAALMTGAQPMSYLPLATTMAFSALFVAVALWRFDRLEL